MSFLFYSPPLFLPTTWVQDAMELTTLLEERWGWGPLGADRGAGCGELPGFWVGVGGSHLGR